MSERYRESSSCIGILRVPLKDVQENFKKYDEQVCFFKGWFKDTLLYAPIVNIDAIGACYWRKVKDINCENLL
ncbi:TylF/MycF/NovP-related O-methyltransferase [Peribacillus frigoritolerans]